MGDHRRSGSRSNVFTIDAGPIRGRHRVAAPRNGAGVKAATVAAATGAVLAGGAQLGAATASAAPVIALPTLPAGVLPAGVALPTHIELPEGVELPGIELPESIDMGSPIALPDLGGGVAAAQQWANDQLETAAPLKARTVQPVSGTLTSDFGSRWGAHHGGLDIAAPIGTPVLAATDGTVISAGAASGFGLWVRVQADDGTITVYGHVNDYQVYEGQRVSAGDQIATVGNRGQSTGPHLHFEVWDQSGNKVDPGKWLRDRGVSVTWLGRNA